MVAARKTSFQDAEVTLRVQFGHPVTGREGEEASRCHGGAAGETTHVGGGAKRHSHLFTGQPSAPLLHGLLLPLSVKPTAVRHSSSSLSVHPVPCQSSLRV